MAPPEGRASPAPAIGALVGPTAVGKTELALAVARRLPVEILVADSRQVYRGMDVGTAKPGAAERNLVPHHLLDLVDPDQRFTVADWVIRARELIPTIVGRGRLPLVVGGTGLYVAALIDGYRFEAAPWSPERRALLLEELEAEGLSVLVDRLIGLDPTSGDRVDLHNPKRVVAALERLLTAGGSASASIRAAPHAGPIVVLGLTRPRAVLQRRINERAAALFGAGLLKEVSRLLAAGFGSDLAPMTGHGYREAARVVEGRWPVEQAIGQTALHTRQYAKRQMTWFRRDPRVIWLEAGDRPADDPSLVERATELLRPLIPRPAGAAS